jgi:light-regulated signal transduction histidine kinase (bacteriophytochrome)
LVKDENQLITKQNAAEKSDTKQSDLDELTYIISHDLQEPLRMITSYVQLLNKRYSDKLDDNAREYIKYAVDGSNRLKQMMDDLLTYSRIGRPDFKTSQLSLDEVLEKTRKHLSNKYPQDVYTLRTSFNGTDTITADEGLMIKLFYNIIDNALKFNHNKKPAIEINAADEDNQWVLSVKDDGMGIEKEYHGKIFGIFQKLHNHSEYPGSGIGLAICEKIAAKHNGRIWVDSEIGKGTTFYISIAKN